MGSVFKFVLALFGGKVAQQTEDKRKSREATYTSS